MFARIRRCAARGVCVSARAGTNGPLPRFTASFLIAAAFFAFAAPAMAVTVEKRVVASSDDAEEGISDGTVYLTSSDLELTFDASINTNQVVGMRFTGLAIPPGATITTAWIQFTSKEAQSETTTVLIQAQAADTASTFTTAVKSISTRPRTGAGTTWIPVPWIAGQTTIDQRTPDFKSVVQEVVNRPGWASGNPIVIIITGTGHRTPYSFDVTSTQCPLLHVEFTTGTVTNPTAVVTATQLASPPLTVRADGSTSQPGNGGAIASYTFNWGDGSTNTVTTAPTAAAQHPYASAGQRTITLTVTDAAGHTSAPATTSINVSATDAAPVAGLKVTQSASPPLTVSADASTSTDTDATPIASYRFTFGDGTAAVVTTAPTATAPHTYTAAGTYTVSVIATDTGGLASAAATSSITVTPPVTGGTTVEKRTVASSDDAEEYSTGVMYLNSSDLELIHDSTDQTVGMLWTGLAIPQGASITAAYIQFRSKENQSEVTNLTFRGQAADSATTFTMTNNNVTSRTRTTASMAWSPAPWTAGQLGINTPDMSPVIQEIVSRPGWKSGNALAVIVNGTGHRTAWAFDGDPVNCPLLHVEYQLAGAPTAQLAVTPQASPPYTVRGDGAGSSATDGKTIASYRFTWGDGSNPSTVNAPNTSAPHTYSGPGTYTVSLIVTDSGGRTSPAATRSVTFTAEAAPVARVTVSQLANPQLTARADVSGSTDPDVTPIASYSINFGDGSAADVITPPATTKDHTYSAPGPYTVTVIATDTGGLTSTPATASVTVQAEQIPVAHLSVTQLVPTPAQTVRADGSTSTDPDHTPIASYRFDWGDGSTPTVTTAPTATAQHAYAAGGSYTVTLIATDTGGNASAPVTQGITVVAENAPAAGLAVNQLVTPALTVRADGSSSTDADLTPIASYRFTWGDGTAAVTITAPNATAQHTYTAAGTYTVSMIATDTGGNASTTASQSITVVPENPPVARLTATQLPNPATTVSADASASTDVDLTPIASYRFDWGDGSSPTTGSAATAQHTYSVPGNFTVTVVATDNVGNASSPASATVPVLGQVSTEKRVAASSDDAEERVSNGSVTITSSTLELTTASSNQQIVGIRWAGIGIPKGSTISGAYIQFTAAASNTGTMALTIAGQAADNAATFTTGSKNVSSRAKTSATVAWAPGSWTSGQAGSAQRTPDLTAIIQEIVNRSGWANGNALALIISGTGTRTAQPYDGSATAAPLLHIDYLGTGNGPTARLSVSQTGALSASADGSASTAGDSPIASYRFTWGDGSSATTTTSPTATHAYSSTGTYTVTLIVTDTAGRPSAPVSADVTISSSGSGPLAVYVGYYDTHHTEHLRTKPSPWYGSSGITFVGTPDSGTNGWDSSGIRIDNTTSSSVTFTATIDMGSSHFGLWGSRTVPAGGTIVLAQTGFENFDGSDTNPAGCYGCNPNLCTTQVQSTKPVVHITVGSTTTNYYDNGQISNTHGVDMAGCPDTGGTRNDESQVWTQIFPQGAAALMASAHNARDEEPMSSPLRTLSFAPVFPNPAGLQLSLRYTIPSLDNVEIGIYDITGRRIQSNSSQDLPAGEYVSVVNLSRVPAGLYYCTLRVGNRTLHQRFAHIR